MKQNWKTGIIVTLMAALCHCSGGGDPEPAASESAVLSVIKAAPFYPDEMKGVDTASIMVSAVVQAPAPETKSALRDVTSPVQASIADGQWQWTVGSMTTGDYTVRLTYQMESIPVATGAFPVRIENGAGTVTVTRDGFTDVGGGDLDGDGLTNLKETLLKTNPAKADTDGDELNDGVETATDPLKADTDGDGVNDKQDAFPLDPKESKDSDGDGVGENVDNCATTANPKQEDVDHDGKGDACDAINDDIQDTDGDGVIDKNDAFPLDPTETKDMDQDTVGDNKDNCPKVANTAQTNTDKILAENGAPVTPDGKGDACDDDLDGDGRNVVYVDGKVGDDNNTGYFKSPVKSLTRAILLANASGGEVWITMGDYNVSDVVWLKGMKFRGGYTDSFDPKKRITRTYWVVDYNTRLLAPGKTSVLVLQNLSTDVTFDSIMIDSDAVSVESSAAVIVDNSVATFSNCTIRGNALAKDSTALKLQNKAFATLDGNTLYPYGTSQGINSRGLWVTNSAVTARNNIIIGGKAKHVFGVSLESSTALLSNNTIDAVTSTTTQEFSTGVFIDLKTSPKLLNNLIMVHGNQAEGIEFETGIRSADGIMLKYNLIHSDGDPVPLVRDWMGRGYPFIANGGDFQKTTADGPLLFSTLLSPGSVVGNKAHTGKTLDLVTPDDYLPKAPSPVIDAGMDTSDPGNGGVITDWWGLERSKWGAYDIGAREGS